MAIIPMTNTFTVCPEGTHVFRIYKVEYDEDFGRLIIHLVHAQGCTIRERFDLMRANGEANDGACNAFSFFAKTALNDASLEAVDPETLVDCYIKADVVHTVMPSTKDPSKTVTFANLGRNKGVALSFDTTPVAKALTLGKEAVAVTPAVATPTPAPVAPAGGLDINALLNS